MLQPDLEALVDDVPGHPAEEEVDRAEGRKVHRLEILAPAAVLGQLEIVLGVVWQRGEPLLQVRWVGGAVRTQQVVRLKLGRVRLL